MGVDQNFKDLNQNISASYLAIAKKIRIFLNKRVLLTLRKVLKCSHGEKESMVEQRLSPPHKPYVGMTIIIIITALLIIIIIVISNNNNNKITITKIIIN